MRMPVVLVRHVVRSAWGLVGAASRIRVGGGDYGAAGRERSFCRAVASIVPRPASSRMAAGSTTARSPDG